MLNERRLFEYIANTSNVPVVNATMILRLIGYFYLSKVWAMLHVLRARPKQFGVYSIIPCWDGDGVSDGNGDGNGDGDCDGDGNA